jgi:DNA-binding NarL/FixJ family response regulator
MHAREDVMLEQGTAGATTPQPGAMALPVEGGRTTRILIVDDHEVVRLGLRAILEARPGWKVVAEAADGKQAIAKALATKPDIVIMDDSLPMITGVEATRQICARLPDTQIMIFTIRDTDILADELLAAGAHACVSKSEARKYLVAGVESLLCGRPFFNGRVYGRLFDTWSAHHRTDNLRLSPRERVVVQLVAEGHSNKEMAAILSLSVKTIETHRAAAMRKLNVTSVASLVRYAVRNKLVEP